MPDWTYQTVFRPALLSIGPQRGLNLALKAMGLLSRLPWGRFVIRFMGHMHPDSRLAIERNGLTLPSPVGLSCRLDPRMQATPAFAEFGFGFLEIGPISTNPVSGTTRLHYDAKSESLRFEHGLTPLNLDEAVTRLQKDGPLGIPRFARIEPASAADGLQLIERLAPHVEAFIISVQALPQLIESPVTSLSTRLGSRPILIAVDSQSWHDDHQRQLCLSQLREGRVAGFVVQATSRAADSVDLGKPGFNDALQTVRQIRSEIGPSPIVIGAVGLHAPIDALDYTDAGADLVQIDSGLVFAGPSLAKRVNAALLYRRVAAEPSEPAIPLRAASQGWFWALAMGLSMFFGGLLALIIASTRVVMHYDEAMAGLTRDQLSQVNSNLLPFMTHDRVTLAGTMLAVGIVYSVFAWWGVRRGIHWAYVSIIVSALAGFLSFFSFLGFGYFDPFHAFVTGVLFQFLVLTVYAGLPARPYLALPDLWNDGRWRANQWGQLLFVIEGSVLIVAGTVISIVGMTSVFVHEDLEFMRTTVSELTNAHPQLIPLIAHDRATFGGMLISCGAVTFFAALWGFQRGQAWLWWGLMSAGTLAFCSTILVHWRVGYNSLMHLLPAYIGLEWLWMAGLFSYPFLVKRDPRLESEWHRRLREPNQTSATRSQ